MIFKSCISIENSYKTVHPGSGRTVNQDYKLSNNYSVCMCGFLLICLFKKELVLNLKTILKNEYKEAHFNFE